MGQVRLQSGMSKGARRKPASSRGVRLSPTGRRKDGRFQPNIVTRGARSVSLRARSFDASTLQFEFVLASETPCRTYRITRNWDLVEVEEVLPMSAISTLKRKNGWPLLDCHSSWSARDVLGRITALRVEGTELIGTAFLSDRDDVAGIARDLETGVLCEFSVGFDIIEDGDVVERAGKLPLVTVKEWTVREGSLVPIPADDTAFMRMSARSLSHARASGRSGSVPTIITAANGNRTMTNEELAALLTGFRSAHDALMTGLEGLVSDAGTDDDIDAEAEAAAEEARAAVLAKRSKGGKPAGQTETTTERSAAEKATILGLRTACAKRGLKDEFDAMEKSGASIAELRGVLSAGLRTNANEIDGTTKPTTAARGKLVSFDQTSRGKAAAK